MNAKDVRCGLQRETLQPVTDPIFWMHGDRMQLRILICLVIVGHAAGSDAAGIDRAVRTSLCRDHASFDHLYGIQYVETLDLRCWFFFLVWGIQLVKRSFHIPGSR